MTHADNETLRGGSDKGPYRRPAGRVLSEKTVFDFAGFAADAWVVMFFVVVVYTLFRWPDVVDATATFVMGFAPRG